MNNGGSVAYFRKPKPGEVIDSNQRLYADHQLTDWWNSLSKEDQCSLGDNPQGALDNTVDSGVGSESD